MQHLNTKKHNETSCIWTNWTSFEQILCICSKYPKQWLKIFLLVYCFYISIREIPFKNVVPNLHNLTRSNTQSTYTFSELRNLNLHNLSNVKYFSTIFFNSTILFQQWDCKVTFPCSHGYYPAFHGRYFVAWLNKQILKCIIFFLNVC